jgi:hypothetical protein
MYRANVGEPRRTLVNYPRPVLKTTKVQAFGGSNPSPSATVESSPASVDMPDPDPPP